MSTHGKPTENLSLPSSHSPLSPLSPLTCLHTHTHTDTVEWAIFQRAVCREYSIAETTIQQMREAIDISGDGHVSQLEFNLLTVGGGLEEALQKLQRDHSGGADGVEQILPDGWERVSHRLPDGTAKAYYINHKTKTTQWEPPKALNLCGKCGCLRSPTDFSPLELEKVDGFCNACLDLTVGGGTIDKRGDCPACNKGVYANQPRSNVHGSYYHAGCLAAQSAAGGARPGTGQADTYLPEIIRPSPGAEEPAPAMSFRGTATYPSQGIAFDIEGRAAQNLEAGMKIAWTVTRWNDRPYTRGWQGIETYSMRQDHSYTGAGTCYRGSGAGIIQGNVECKDVWKILANTPKDDLVLIINEGCLELRFESEDGVWHVNNTEEELDDFKLPDIVGKKMENPHLVLTADESINVLVGCMSAGMHQAKQAQGKGTKLSKGSSMMVLYVDLPWR